MLSAARCGGMLAAWHAVHWYVNVLLECRLVTVDEVSIEKLPTVLVHASGRVLHTLSVRVARSVGSSYTHFFMGRAATEG